MNDFDGHPYAAPVEPGENNTTRLRNVADTDLWGLVLPKTVTEALEPAVATLDWRTDGSAIGMLLTLRPHFQLKV